MNLIGIAPSTGATPSSSPSSSSVSGVRGRGVGVGLVDLPSVAVVVEGGCEATREPQLPLQGPSHHLAGVVSGGGVCVREG